MEIRGKPERFNLTLKLEPVGIDYDGSVRPVETGMSMTAPVCPVCHGKGTIDDRVFAAPTVPVPVPANASKYGPYVSYWVAIADMGQAHEQGLITPNGLEGGLLNWYFYAWKTMSPVHQTVAGLPESYLFDQLISQGATLVADYTAVKAGVTVDNVVKLISDVGTTLNTFSTLFASLSGVTHGMHAGFDPAKDSVLKDCPHTETVKKLEWAMSKCKSEFSGGMKATADVAGMKSIGPIGAAVAQLLMQFAMEMLQKYLTPTPPAPAPAGS